MTLPDLEYVPQGGDRWAAVRQEFVEAQAGQCAICREDVNQTAHLDHCHVTGHIRGALCLSCNAKLGWYEKRRREVEEYLARAGEFEAYRVPERRKRNRLT